MRLPESNQEFINPAVPGFFVLNERLNKRNGGLEGEGTKPDFGSGGTVLLNPKYRTQFFSCAPSRDSDSPVQSLWFPAKLVLERKYFG